MIHKRSTALEQTVEGLNPFHGTQTSPLVNVIEGSNLADKFADHFMGKVENIR